MVLIFSLSHSHVQPINASIQQSSGMDNSKNKSIDLCCRWGKQISDGELKYKLINMLGKQKEVVREAFDSWNKQLTTLQLVEVRSYDQRAEILVTVGDISTGDSGRLVNNVEAGQTAGQSVNNLDGDGFITNASILLSDEIFNMKSDSNPLFAVLLHEIGHALGLGHANFDDLMNPVVTADVKGVSVCDANGVVKTNELTLKKEVRSHLPANPGKQATVDCE